MKNIEQQNEMNNQTKENIDSKKLSIIYEIISQGFVLTKEILNIYSFTKEEINLLIKNKFLIEIENNKLELNQTNGLYEYGIYLLLHDIYPKAIRCFNMCYKLEPNNIDYCKTLLLLTLKYKNYKESLELLTHIKSLHTDESYNNNYYMYIYLLNIITDIDNIYLNELKDIDINDIIYSKINPYLPKDEYEIRKSISIHKFKYAYELISKKIKYQKHKEVLEDKILKEILSQVTDIEELFKQELSQNITNEHYALALKMLESKIQKRFLNNQETYIYLLIKVLLEILDTKVIPIPTIASTRYLYDAIKGNNFILAQDINREFLIKIEKNKEKDLIDILLNKINTLILEIKLDIENEEKEKRNTSKQDEIEDKYLLSDVRKQIKYEKEEKEFKESYQKSIEEVELSFEQEIANYIKIETITIEEAKKKLGLMPDQVLLIKLIFAKEAFIDGDEQLGNKLLKEVEQSKDKTKSVKKILTEITRNKKTYKEEKKVKTRKKVLEANKQLRSDIKC